MKNAQSTGTKILPLLVIAGVMAALSAPPAVAQTAKKLNCNGCVKSKQIKNSGVKSKDIKDGQVKNADLANDAVDGNKIADGAVGSADLANNAVTTGKIADGTVGTADLADDTVDSAKVLDNSLTASDLATDSVGADEIAVGAVGSSEVATNAIPATDLSNEAGGDFIEDDDFQDLTGTNTVRSIEVTPPRGGGIVIVNSGGYCVFDVTPSQCVCAITTGTEVGGIVVAASGDATRNNKFGNIATTRAFSVFRGLTTRYNLVCSETLGQVRVADAVLTAIYVPTRY